MELAKSKVVAAGDVFGHYTVIDTYKEHGVRSLFARVQCSCGSPPRYVRIDTLRNGTSLSCGCLQKASVTKHGLWKHPLFKVWKAMLSRCTNPRDKRYARYGGRGITVCERWTGSPHAFIEDMTTGYSEGMTIDRIDNNGHYSPENCRWNTKKQQNRNYSRNVILEHDGKRLCVADWAIELNVPAPLLYDRLARGWSAKDTLTKPRKGAPRKQQRLP